MGLLLFGEYLAAGSTPGAISLRNTEKRYYYYNLGSISQKVTLQVLYHETALKIRHKAYRAALKFRHEAWHS